MKTNDISSNINSGPYFAYQGRRVKCPLTPLTNNVEI